MCGKAAQPSLHVVPSLRRSRTPWPFRAILLVGGSASYAAPGPPLEAPFVATLSCRHDLTMTLPARPSAVVTGASSGIGRAIALALAERGARLFLAGRDRGRLEEVAAACDTPHVHAADLTEDDAVARLGDLVVAAFAGLDVLVHSMGAYVSGLVAETPVTTLDSQYRTNVRAPYLVTQALIPALAEAGGQVVFVNSSVGVKARGGLGAYAASKHALKALADSLRDEVNPVGVRVLTVYSGRTATPMQRQVFAQEGRVWTPQRLLQPEDVARAVLAALDVPRTAEITDLHLRPMVKT
jgi:short-subunit dehydrogenase